MTSIEDARAELHRMFRDVAKAKVARPAWETGLSKAKAHLEAAKVIQQRAREALSILAGRPFDIVVVRDALADFARKPNKEALWALTM